ncbi:chaoptin-like protein 2 [Sarcoptes scabiei]|uniref:Chaoptin-like protein 2 n=1 Tax=Sarcoptes scabiei TaxID=52283 RepID=A0A132A187_SARSC|nr:chaoptin-like protein 2 [Sarcoptes scabiei]
MAKIDLEDLRLQNNHLQHIRKGVFYSLPNLKNLDLQMNRIESIESFESLANIQNINLQGNRLRTFNGNVLSSFHSSLSYLNLANNQLISIENDTFRNRNKLEIIWLNHNQIKQISANAFDGLSGAEKLYLDHNKINFIEEKAFFSMKSLTYLNLEYNQLAHLTRNMFEGLESLIELRLKSSEIIGIEANFLSCFKLLQILDLSDNRIYSIRKNMFQSGDSITELYLSNAMIDEIEKDSFANLQSLRLLDLSRNSINARQMNVLKLPGSIKKLNISWNNLSNEKGTKLNANFINQLGPSLEILDLSSTQFDLSDTQNFFSSLTNLRELYLNGNEIDKIENGSFPIENGLNYPSILTITLDTNHLETIPSNQIIAKFAPSLHSFSLAQNQIKKISSNAFFGLKKLQRLDLSTNRISIIESFAFNGLDRLQHLDLSGNVLRTLSDHVFDNLPNLSRLSLAKNWLQFIPTNFIRSETNRSFSSTTSVTTKIELDIAHNPLVRLIESSNLKLNFKTNSDIYDHIRIFELLILNAENGNLTLISAEDFRPFPSLIVLKLKQNLIRTILPASFLPLSKLSVLDLSVNKLESFSSDQLNGLNRLEHLNVSHNLLIESPSFVSEIQKLQSLDISYNRISRIESFGHLSDSLKHLYIRHNMISYIADNAFQNLTSLRMIDLRENFLTQISDNIFESIEVRLETILFSGNPFKCDCQLLSIYRWLEEHQRLVRKIQDDLIKAELICDQPERLKNVPITSLQPVDFCPIPIITLLKVIDLDSNSLRLMWDVQNETLVSGFTLEYYLTSERSLTSPAGLHVNSGTRSAELRDLMADKWYTLCVEAKGKSSRPQPSPLSSLSSVSIEKNLDPSRTKIMQLIENPPIVDYMISDPPDQKKLLLKDFVAGNHKCLQVRPLFFHLFESSPGSLDKRTQSLIPITSDYLN